MAVSAKDSKLLEQKDLISQLNTTIAAQTELIQSLKKDHEADREQIQNLLAQVDYLTKKLFGTSSEKMKDVEGQLNLFDEAEQEADVDLKAPVIKVPEHTRRKKRTLEELFKGVPSRDEIISLPEGERVCDECGAAIEPIGKEFVRHEFRFTPAKGEDGLPPIVLYHYTETRARYNAVDFFDGFSDGYLETDGYQGYNNLPSIRRCSCWAHTRRYFIDAVPKGKQYDYSNPAVQGVQFCSKLFEYERRSHNKKHTFEQRKAYRLEKEKPILDAFWSWLDEQKPRKGSRFETAVKYAQNRKDTLMTYLEDGHCSLSNNLSENAIRPFTVGRKNWLFSATPKGATASALVYTMVEMAKANELNIYKYLTYLLEHRPSEDMSDEQLEALTPWSKEVQNVCKN